MVDSRTCLFPGRFQPLHNGHALALRSIAERYRRVVVSISQAHLSHTEKDPLTGGERFTLIREFLRAEQLDTRVDVIPVPTDAFPTTWVPFIRAIAPHFDVVHARNPLIREVFAYWGYPLDTTILERTASATEVRRRMVAGEDWVPLVPAAIVEGLKSMQLVDRLQQLAKGANV